jgi:hypothetical protein
MQNEVIQSEVLQGVLLLDEITQNELSELDLEHVSAGMDKITGNLRWSDKKGGGGFIDFGAYGGNKNSAKGKGKDKP